MAQAPSTSLDVCFAALADPTRRALLARLQKGDATVSQLAAPFAMTLTGLKKHLLVLEAAGLVATHKRGRTRHVRLRAGALHSVTDFLDPYRVFVTARFDAAAHYIDLSDMDVT